MYPSFTEKQLGGSCNTTGTTTECLDSNSTCTAESGGGGNKCRCTTGHYDSDLDDNNVGGTCTPSKLYQCNVIQSTIYNEWCCDLSIIPLTYFVIYYTHLCIIHTYF